ncbi:MAG: DUF4916 domain-containing protein [Methanococcaceae archaeon]
MKNVDPIKYKEIQDLIPICCVDILPLRLSGDKKINIESVGLIFRDTPHQGKRWCLVGGRLGRNEKIIDAISRELYDALGKEIIFSLNENLQPNYVAEYFSIPRDKAAYDPRQHAIGLTFCIPVSGSVIPQREALDFNWFKISDLPSADEFGFDQNLIVKACLDKYEIHKQLPGA